MNRDIQLLKQIRDQLREMKVWLKLSGIPQLRKLAPDNFGDDIDRMVYELSDVRKALVRSRWS